MKNLQLAALILILMALPVKSLAQNIEFSGSTLVTGLNDIAISSQFAFGSFPNGLGVFDISDSDSIRFVAKLDCPGVGKAISISGQYAFLAAFHRGMNIVDVSNPLNPIFISNLDAPGMAYDISLDGNYAYLAVNDTGISIVDISNVYSPQLIGSLNTYGWAGSLVARNGYLYVSNGDSGMQVINVNNPQNPQIVGHLPGLYRGIAVSGNYAYLIQVIPPTFRWKIMIADISDPAAPESVGAFESFNDIPTDLAIVDTILYATAYDGFLVVNIADPGSPQLINRFGQNGSRLAVQDSIAYIVHIPNSDDWDDAYFSLKTFNIANPANPSLISRYQLPAVTRDVVVRNGLGYVANHIDGLRIMDLSNAQDPQILGTYVHPAISLSLQGDYAYLSPFFETVYIGVPNNPQLWGSFDPPDGAVRNFVSGNYAYIPADSAFLMILDISNNAYPYKIGQVVRYGDYAEAVQVVGNYAYEVGLLGGIKVFDVSDPSHPTFADSLDTPGHALDIFISGQYAYVADGDSGLFIADISNAPSPTFASRLAFPGSAPNRVFVEGNYAYLASFVQSWRDYASVYGMLHVVDITDPHNPILIASKETSGRPSGLCVVDQKIYLADYFSLMVYDFNTTNVTDDIVRPRTTQAISNYPNPFNSMTDIRYSVTRQGQINLSIYNIMGQKVETLFSGFRYAGNYGIEWEANGFSSGIYFARLSTADGISNKRMLLLK